MAASLLMASLQASLRILVAESDSPARVAERLNSLFISQYSPDPVCDASPGPLRSVTRTLLYCNAGHNPAAAVP